MSYKKGRAVGLTFVHGGPVLEHTSHRSPSAKSSKFSKWVTL
jgi:hypothetical protein